MNVLFVCSGNAGHFTPFIREQAESIRRMGISVDYFLIRGHGIKGYLKNLPLLIRTLNKKRYDVVHAHYGLAGLFAVLQHKVPVVITFHGSDIGRPKHRVFSLIAKYFSNVNIFVADRMLSSIPVTSKDTVIPCGVDLDVFFPVDFKDARKEMRLDLDKTYFLFAGSYKVKRKNRVLAEEAVTTFGKGAILIQLKGYARHEVNLLMNAANALIVTSYYEGSPQVVKEALASNTPVVSVDVGDVKNRLEGVVNCYIAEYDSSDIARKLALVTGAGKRAENGRESVKIFGLNEIAMRIIDVYQKAVSKSRYQIF